MLGFSWQYTNMSKILQVFNEYMRSDRRMEANAFKLATYPKFVEIGAGSANYIRKSISDFLSTEKNWRSQYARCCFLTSFLFRKFGDSDVLRHYQNIIAYAPSISLAHDAYWNLISSEFVNTGKSNRDLLFVCFGRLSELLVEHFGDMPPVENDPSGKKCFIVVDQFLGEAHAPTKTCLEIYTSLVKHGFDPLILNTREPPEVSTLPLVAPYVAVSDPSINRATLVEVDGSVYKIRSLSSGGLTNTKLGELSSCVAQYQPAFVLNVGGLSIMVEWLSRRLKTIIFNSTTTLVPRGHAHRVFVSWDLHDVEESFLNNYDAAGKSQYRRLSRGGYKNSEVGRVLRISKKEFGLGANQFIIGIASNRLATEIGPEELIFFNELAKTNERVVFVFFGALQNECRERFNRQLSGVKAVFAGHREDFASALSISDVYINTRRRGGGHSAATALALGIPVYSIDFGDVASFLPEAFLAPDYTTLLSIVSAEFEPLRNEKSKAEALSIFSGFKSMDQKVIEMLEESGFTYVA